MQIFKVWNRSRTIKVFVPLDDTGDLYEHLILKASERMQINGAVLCLESDGTTIDDSAVLRMVGHEILMLLQPGEAWHSAGEISESDASASTVSVRSDLDIGSEDNFACGSSSEVQVLSEYSWKVFAIPWDKMKLQTLQDCDNNIRAKRSIADVIHVTVDAMRHITKNISSKAIKIVGNKIISKYPKVFQDVDEDNVVLGDGSHSVFSKIKEHLKYLNRPHKRTGEQINIPLGKKKLMLASKAGCKNWQPDIMEKSVEEIRIELQHYADKTEDVLLPMLEKTYPHQRAYLNTPECPTIQKVGEDWPILLSRLGLVWHYKALMGHDITKLTDNMNIKANKIINFGEKHKLITTTVSSTSDNEINYKLILKVLVNYFKEDMNYIHRNTHGETHEMENSTNNAPYIAETDPSSYVIVMEQKKILDGNSFKEAIENLFALYYIFNLEYPKRAAYTLETMQRYFLKIHPDQGSKNKKSSKAKIIGLLTKLRDA